MTHNILTKWISEHGGHFKKNIPSSDKLVSTQKHTILVDRESIGHRQKAPKAVKTGIRFGHITVDYEYVTDC
jgi:hypothetical protein